MFELVLTLPTEIVTVGAPSCVVVPGWSVIVVATLLTAPRLVKELGPARQG